MKQFICCLLFMIGFTQLLAQGPMAEMKFHQGSNLYINGNPDKALAAVNEGLAQDPQNIKLQTLKKVLEQEKKEQEKKEQEQKQKEKQKQQQEKQQQQKEKEQQEKEQKEQEQKNKEDQEKKDKENKDNKNKPEEEKDEKAKKEAQKQEEQKDQEKKDKDKQELPPEVKQRLEEMKISEEKAKMILEALKNQEIQYLQQNKREAQKRNNSGKPDW